MKIALVHREFSERGGCERFGLGFARWLVARGHAVDLWCQRAEGAPTESRVRTLDVGGRGRIWKMLSLWRAAGAVRRDAYDAVLSLGRTPGGDVYRAGGGCHRAWVERRGWSVADAVEVALDRRVVLGAGRVVANSAMAAQELVRWYGLDPRRLQIIHNGVDLERFRPEPRAPLPLPGPAAVFVGNGFQRKGLLTAMRALARVQGLHLAVIGSDPRPARWRRHALELGLEGRVHFLGPVPRPEALLPAAAAFLLPTRYDPFSNAVLEALACGVPALTSAANGAAEILPQTWMCVADPTDDRGFALALERALHEPGLREACRAAAEAHPASLAFAQLSQVIEESRR